jgi:hypothetical protein
LYSRAMSAVKFSMDPVEYVSCRVSPPYFI